MQLRTNWLQIWCLRTQESIISAGDIDINTVDGLTLGMNDKLMEELLKNEWEKSFMANPEQTIPPKNSKKSGSEKKEKHPLLL